MITKNSITIAALILLSFVSTHVFSQDDLMALLQENEKPDPGYASSTFKSTRVINSHSVETLAAGSLDFRISHRFGRLNSGAYNFYGLDEATMRLGLEYGVTDHVTLGLGRSTFQKTYDGFAKVKLFRQRKNSESSFPVSITWFSNMAINTLRNGDQLIEDNSEYRFSYAHQLIIARRFSERLSLQLAPIVVHRNLKEASDFSNDTYAVQVGGRFKLSKRVSLNADYIYRLPDYQDKPYYNSLSLGFDIETGGHVFQLHFTNSLGMIEQTFVNQTTGQWGKGDIHYGFNISRQFTIGKRK